MECLANPFHVNKELRLFKFVSEFIAAYHDLTKLVTTPFPFPLVQMSRTFVLLWVFSLPLSLVYDMETLPALLFLIFFVTFGFVGLEFVAVEFDDPFGDDENDFDWLGLARVVFEDLYISIYDVDGQHAADALRRGVESSTAHRRSMKTKSLSSSSGPTASKSKKTSASGRHKRHCSFDAFNNSVAAPTVGADRSRLLLDASSRLNQNMTLSQFVEQQQQQELASQKRKHRAQVVANHKYHWILRQYLLQILLPLPVGHFDSTLRIAILLSVRAASQHLLTAQPAHQIPG